MNPRKLARLIHPAYWPGRTDHEEALRLAELGVGGFCFYAGSADETREAARSLKASASSPLLISSDYEDGAAQRVSGATALPSNMAIGASGSEALARRKGEITALEARALGVDWVFAPVLDLATRPGNPIVNVRAFGACPAPAAVLGSAFISGVASQGALSCIKHFPGHGETETDSHLALPVVAAGRAALEERELKPFAALAGRADSVMVGHLSLPAVDPYNPASLSPEIIGGMLRRGLRYGGLVLTDALNMKALSQGGEAGVRAFLAGADVLLYPEEPRALLAALVEAAEDGRISEAAVDAALARQDALVRRLSPFRSEPAPRGALRCPEHLAFNAEAAPRCLAWAYGRGAFSVKPGETVGYFEPLTRRADWKGTAFVDGLEKLGVRVEPYQPGCGMKLAAGVFSRPRAYSGSINMAEEENRALCAAVAGSASAAVLAFGSPFVLNGLAPRPAAALCAFCALDDFQRCAAGVLAGAAEASGVMPVKIEE